MPHAGVPSARGQAPVFEAGWRHHVWLGFLVAVVSSFSVLFACATPFAALGAIGALTLSRGDALRLTAASWLVDQVIGYAALGYPRTADSFAWAGAIGAAALLSTVVSRWIATRVESAGPVAQAPAALLGAFAAYEVVLLAVAVAGLGGTASFAPSIVGRILAVNALALVGLYGFHRLGVVAGLREPGTLRVGVPIPSAHP